MDIVRAFTSFRRSPQFIKKLGGIAILGALCFVPMLGLIPLCALLGYWSRLIHNIMNDYPRPLPTWRPIGDTIRKGLVVFFALALYHGPLILAALAMTVFRASMADSLFGDFAIIGIASVGLPCVMVYLLFAWSMFGIGLVRFAECWRGREFYRFGMILSTMGSNVRLTLRWLAAVLAVNIVLTLLLPVLLLGPLLFIPTQGYLTGLFGRRLRAARIKRGQGKY